MNPPKIANPTPDLPREKVFEMSVERSDDFWIVLDERRSLKEMIAAGYYISVAPDLLRFPVPEHVLETELELNVQLLRFSEALTTDEVLNWMKEHGYRPARIDEFLALGAMYPQLQVRFPIVELGSACIVSGEQKVACLVHGLCKRTVELYPFNASWNTDYRFAAVRQN
jgi:hypothetical protein